MSAFETRIARATRRGRNQRHTGTDCAQSLKALRTAETRPERHPTVQKLLEEALNPHGEEGLPLHQLDNFNIFIEDNTLDLADDVVWEDLMGDDDDEETDDEEAYFDHQVLFDHGAYMFMKDPCGRRKMCLDSERIENGEPLKLHFGL